MTARWFFNLYVFIGGAAVMLLEFAASRLLAPYFGTSIFVWGNIIGAILIALSIGYIIGGKLADRKPDISVISRAVLVACVLVSLIPVLLQWLVVPLTTIQTVFSVRIGFSIIGSFIAIVGLFAVPVVLLGMISPFLIRVATTDVKSAGTVAGGLYAWSTIGSIVGTFAGAFFVVPWLGSRETIFISAMLLGVMGSIGVKRYYAAAVLIIPIVFYVWFYQQPLRADAVVLEEGETLYQYYAVTDEVDRLLLQYNEGLGTQSFYMKQGVATGSYYDYVVKAPAWLDRANGGTAAVLGLAGGTLTRQLTTYYPNWAVTGVELDGQIVDVAKRYFHLAEQPITIVVDDGRNFMQTTTEQFDVIFIDVFTNEYYIPWHMTTLEFMETLAEHQPADGMIALNIGSAGEDTYLFKAMLNTLQAVYPYVYVQAVPDSINYAVFASRQPLSIEAKQYEPDHAVPVLTDNRAPVELYTEQMVWRYILDL